MTRALRPAARILLVDGEGRVLLFRFDVPGRPPFWVTPGGALDPGEDFAAAARRELREETGIDADPGPEVARREVEFVTVEDVPVLADERYFRVDAASPAVDAAGHTELERRVMTRWRWFRRDEIAGHDEAIYPVDLHALLTATDPDPEPRTMTLPLTRLALSTGVELDIALAGDPAAPPVILLHGFPESHRTWRHQIPALAADHYVIAPDQRGYARSSKPDGVAAYAPERIVGDLVALADALALPRFALVGHDWGGAVAWMAALRRADRVERLAIVNAPHPLLFQRALFDSEAQRAASQYITAFRGGMEPYIQRIGLPAFLDQSFARHAGAGLAPDERAAYLDEWGQPGAITGMLNWYRASQVVVPAPGEDAPRPAFLDAPFPPVVQPTLVVWGMDDVALPPGPNLDGLDALVPDLTLVRLDGVGHFAPWQAPERVTAALRDWLARR